MTEKINGYNGVVLEVDLSARKIEKKRIDPMDLKNFIGGRGLGIKYLWDRLKDKPGTDPLGPDNPLMFMAGPFSGFPAPSSSRTCVVTKSPLTTPKKSKYPHASTVSYANMGGFFGPELRFAGYDGIVVTGKSSTPVYLYIHDDQVEIRDAENFWGMGTDQFDREFIAALGDPRFRTCYIGPAGENLVKYACIINTAARAAGRGGTGCVMGSKKLKAIAVKGSGQPGVGNHKLFLDTLEEVRQNFKKPEVIAFWREAGTAAALSLFSGMGLMAVKNFREGTFTDVNKIDAEESKKHWVRNFSCYCCPLSCKKSGKTVGSPFAGLIHDGPEYETGTMLGANLLITDHAGLMKAIYLTDDYGIDAISLGNVIGFLMEAYDKKLIDQKFLDGIDLKWGSVTGTIALIHRIAARKGVGDLASKGVRVLADKIGQGSHAFAMHVKGHELAAHNCHANPPRALCYASANRGACHLNGTSIPEQNMTAMADSTGVCMFALAGYGPDAKLLAKMLSAITGIDHGDITETGERIFNLEKMFNYQEGFTRADDDISERFFEEPLTIGIKKGAVLTREQFDTMMDEFYTQRGWDLKTSEPRPDKLKQLGLA